MNTCKAITATGVFYMRGNNIVHTFHFSIFFRYATCCAYVKIILRTVHTHGVTRRTFPKGTRYVYVYLKTITQLLKDVRDTVKHICV